MRLSPAWRKLLLIVHLVAAVGWLGAEVVLLALGVAGVRGAEPRMVYPAARLVAAWLITPAALVALVTGLLQGVLTPWGLFRYWWVTVKLAVTVIMNVLVLLVLLPALGAAADAATAAGPKALDADSQRQLVIAPTVACTLLVLNVVLSVYKPGRRLRLPAG